MQLPRLRIVIFRILFHWICYTQGWESSERSGEITGGAWDSGSNLLV